MDKIIYTLLATHITIISVTLYLHRSQTHRGVHFNPVIEHFFRFWLWLTTGMVTKQWVARHRAHHRHSDRAGDPHSPHIFGIWRVLFGGSYLYHQASKNRRLIDSYGVGTPDDWLERNLYSPHSRLGITLLLVINLLCFSWWGLAIWLVQIIWIPFWAAGVINGVAHWWGYKNGETRDRSRNVSPWGIIIGGECLHNNHHLDPANPRLSRKWWEFDIGWMYICILQRFGLATVTFGKTLG